MKQALDIESIDAAWLSQTLGYAVHLQHVEQVGTGQTGASFRLTLDSAQGPSTLLAKVAAGDSAARARVAAGYAAEVGFYANLAESLPIRTPRCWYAAISPDRLQFTLLLEDLAPRQPGVQAEACSTARAEAAVRNLAGLHAPRWNDAALHDTGFLLGTRGQKPLDFLAGLAAPAIAGFSERYSEELDDADAATLAAVAPLIGAWVIAPQSPFSIVHGDYRLDNLMFGEQPEDVVALDWQTAALGAPTRDLAYFLGTCLETEQRRRVEDELVALYHAELVAQGTTDYDLQQCAHDYRRNQLQATLITCIGCMYATGKRSLDSDAMFLAMARRSCAAIRDLGTLELLS